MLLMISSVLWATNFQIALNMWWVEVSGAQGVIRDLSLKRYAEQPLSRYLDLSFLK